MELPTVSPAGLPYASRDESLQDIATECCVESGMQVTTHETVALHDPVAGEFVEQSPLPPTQLYDPVEAGSPHVEGQERVQVPVGEGVHDVVALHDPVAGEFVEQAPLPPTQLYDWVEAGWPQVEGQERDQVPVGVGAEQPLT